MEKSATACGSADRYGPGTEGWLGPVRRTNAAGQTAGGTRAPRAGRKTGNRTTFATSDLRASLIAPSGKNPPADAGDIRDPSSIPGSGRPPGKGSSNPLQYGSGDSCLENPMDRGAWRATVHGSHRVGHDVAAKPPHQAWEGTSENVYSLQTKTGQHDYIIQQLGDKQMKNQLYGMEPAASGETQKERKKEEKEGMKEGWKEGKEEKRKRKGEGLEQAWWFES